MFEPEECIGIEATDYLIEQGFTAFAESVYEGPDDIITDAPRAVTVKGLNHNDNIQIIGLGCAFNKVRHIL